MQTLTWQGLGFAFPLLFKWQASLWTPVEIQSSWPDYYYVGFVGRAECLRRQKLLYRAFGNCQLTSQLPKSHSQAHPVGISLEASKKGCRETFKFLPDNEADACSILWFSESTTKGKKNATAWIIYTSCSASNAPARAWVCVRISCTFVRVSVFQYQCEYVTLTLWTRGLNFSLRGSVYVSHLLMQIQVQTQEAEGFGAKLLTVLRVLIKSPKSDLWAAAGCGCWTQGPTSSTENRFKPVEWEEEFWKSP